MQCAGDRGPFVEVIPNVNAAGRVNTYPAA